MLTVTSMSLVLAVSVNLTALVMRFLEGREQKEARTQWMRRFARQMLPSGSSRQLVVHDPTGTHMVIWFSRTESASTK